MTTADSSPDSLEDSGFRVLLAALGALPLASYAALLIFAAYATAVTGHWPQYSDPDPKSLPVSAGGPVLLFIALSLLAAPVYALVRLALCWERSAGAAPLSPRVTYLDRAGLACFFTGLALWLTASSYLVNWLLD